MIKRILKVKDENAYGSSHNFYNKTVHRELMWEVSIDNNIVEFMNGTLQGMKFAKNIIEKQFVII